MTNGIWKNILGWLDVPHEPKGWPEEIRWIMEYTTRKSWKASLMKLAITEILYGVCLQINEDAFGNEVHNNTYDRIIENIMYIGWNSKKLREHIAKLMLQSIFAFLFVLIKDQICEINLYFVGLLFFKLIYFYLIKIKRKIKKVVAYII